MSELLKIEDLVGLSKEDAIKSLEEKELTYRIKREDGVSFMVTQEVNVERYNLYIEEGFVVACGMG